MFPRRLSSSLSRITAAGGTTSAVLFSELRLKTQRWQRESLTHIKEKEAVMADDPARRPAGRPENRTCAWRCSALRTTSTSATEGNPVAKKVRTRDLVSKIAERGVNGVSDDPASAVKQLRGLDVPVAQYMSALAPALESGASFESLTGRVIEPIAGESSPRSTRQLQSDAQQHSPQPAERAPQGMAAEASHHRSFMQSGVAVGLRRTPRSAATPTPSFPTNQVVASPNTGLRRRLLQCLIQFLMMN